MQIARIIVECPIVETFRVKQLSGMFDVPVGEKSRREIEFEQPDLEGDWMIGLIIGPSGSGKSLAAKKLFGTSVYRSKNWAKNQCVLDNFDPDISIKIITSILTAIGFSSPPAWLRPYRALSNGEKFRCDLARAIVESDGLVVFDEFTSVVDRNIAKIGSMAISKTIRKNRVPCSKFVAVTCHYDVADWLEPDWILDMGSGRLERGRLRCRPPIRLEIHRCRYEVWKMFAPHHYLSTNLHPRAKCYLATWLHRPICFAATLPNLGHRDCDRISRLVVLPDFQGVGIGGAVLDSIAKITQERGRRASIVTGHPAMIRKLQHNPDWRLTNIARGGMSKSGIKRNVQTSSGRSVVSFRYIGPRK